MSLIFYAAQSQIYIHYVHPLRYEKLRKVSWVDLQLYAGSYTVANSLHKLVTFIVYKIRRSVYRSGASSRRVFSSGTKLKDN